MKLYGMMAGALALTLTGTGCATKKYVAQTVAPVEARVTEAEAVNTTQTERLQAQNDQIESLESDLSLTNERVGDVDAKATAAGTAAQQAGQQAQAAQTAANTAQTAATEARTAGIARANEVEQTLERKLDAVNSYQLSMSETVLFNFDQYTLTDDAKAKLDAIATRTHDNARFVIEVQGFTDKTGNAEYNERLSERRADSVSRYLINQHEIPLRSVNTVGSGYALPVADDATSEGRKMNRRVEVRLFVPEMASASQTVASAQD